MKVAPHTMSDKVAADVMVAVIGMDAVCAAFMDNRPVFAALLKARQVLFDVYNSGERIAPVEVSQ